MPRVDPAPGDPGATVRRGPHELRELRPFPLLAGAGLTDLLHALASLGADVPVLAYTDGACTGNPGPGGWGAILLAGDLEHEMSGGEPRSTNQRMELTGALEVLRAIPGSRPVAIHSDSAYLVNCFREAWWRRWEREGWRNRGNQPVANRDLWESLLAETRRHRVSWHKVRGHAGDPLNERADRLAREAITRLALRP